MSSYLKKISDLVWRSPPVIKEEAPPAPAPAPTYLRKMSMLVSWKSQPATKEEAPPAPATPPPATPPPATPPPAAATPAPTTAPASSSMVEEPPMAPETPIVPHATATTLETLPVEVPLLEEDPIPAETPVSPTNQSTFKRLQRRVSSMVLITKKPANKATQTGDKAAQQDSKKAFTLYGKVKATFASINLKKRKRASPATAALKT
ncbi:hypothetical protein SeMB42_g04985, partial [Synchytrium endobioticum]